MDKSKSLGYALHRLSTVLDRQSDLLLLDRFGIGFSQFKIMMGLQKHENIQQKEIAFFLGQTEASISRQVHTMIENGLVASIVDPENRRQHITRLTPKGIRVAEEAMNALETHFAPMFERLSEAQIVHLRDALDVMTDYACRTRQ